MAQTDDWLSQGKWGGAYSSNNSPITGLDMMNMRRFNLFCSGQNNNLKV